MKNGKKKKKSIEKYFYSFFSLFLILNFSNLFINIRNWIRNQSIPIFGHETVRVNDGINKSINGKKKYWKVFLLLILNFSNLFKIFEVKFEIDRYLLIKIFLSSFIVVERSTPIKSSYFFFFFFFYDRTSSRLGQSGDQANGSCYYCYWKIVDIINHDSPCLPF